MRICILGATGLIGRETIDLTIRAWPDAELALFASRDQELNMPTSFARGLVECLD
jgi:aspartate-semialdehyde dehydrogenase